MKTKHWRYDWPSECQTFWDWALCGWSTLLAAFQPKSVLPSKSEIQPSSSSSRVSSLSAADAVIGNKMTAINKA